ncbi:uncharacterized protein LOC111713403 [Eurytemora carolleeae]|uniref:uncharacterized protein LOC111713403 n=1 Tax=Eurytemora carolleeae TaxID=1294199 RepID=UPI000C783FD8|nr:uncharacterized protein LOC111713403 [Eurytemora carolleeae]XP_023344018.1 uncharacterized protein LOC111713403 [Eurytemora carolleeae]|eukprot:XP_023344017.1 uncharacterized protein LOC111713403 [Eurytemora affinis]
MFWLYRFIYLDLMAEAIKEEINLEEFEMKEETVFKEEKSPPSSTVENTCTIYVQGEEDICTVYVQGEVKPEFTEIEGFQEVDKPSDKEFEILNPLLEKEKKIEDKDETMKKYMFELHEELRKDMKELKQDLKEYIDKKFDELKNPENQAPASNICRVHQGMVKGEETLVNIEITISQFSNELEVLKEAMMRYNSPREFLLFIGTYESYVDLTAERFRQVCPTLNNLLLATFGGVNAASRRAAKIDIYSVFYRAKSRIADRIRKKERRKAERESRDNGDEKKKRMV